MSIRVAINGFGRIGRNALKAYFENDNNSFKIVGINGVKNIEDTKILIKYDSLYGKYDKDIRVEGDYLITDKDKIKVTNIRDDSKLPWRELRVDLVIEATGKYNCKDKALVHINAGAKKVLITAPANKADVTIVMGVNEEEFDYENHQIISNASCTTNCLAPVAKILNDEYGIKRGLMNTVHAFTSNQSVLDVVNKSDIRRARAATESIIPTTTGAAKAVSLVIPELKGKLTGMAMRVPTPTVSVVDLTVELEKKATVEEINNTFDNASNGKYKGILGLTKEPLVSVDYKKDSHSAIVDGLCTMSIDEMVKIVAWYDNEWGYSCRVIDLANYISKKIS